MRLTIIRCLKSFRNHYARNKQLGARSVVVMYLDFRPGDPGSILGVDGKILK